MPLANQEQLQVLRYGIGQQYRDHWDYFEEATLKARGGGAGGWFACRRSRPDAPVRRTCRAEGARERAG